jgi:protease I
MSLPFARLTIGDARPRRAPWQVACFEGMGTRLAGRHVLLIVAPFDFRDEELLEPKARFEAEGAVVEVAAPTLALAHGIRGATVAPDVALSDVDPLRYVAIGIVGGPGAPAYLWGHGGLHALLRVARAHGIPLGAICLAPAVLARAGLLRGVRATVYGDPRAAHELERGGAIRIADGVVVDQGIVTAAGPRDAGAFAEALVRLAEEGWLRPTAP